MSTLRQCKQWAPRTITTIERPSIPNPDQVNLMELDSEELYDCGNCYPTGKILNIIIINQDEKIAYQAMAADKTLECDDC